MKSIILALAVSFALLSTSCTTFTPENPVAYEQQLLSVVDASHTATLAAVAVFPEISEQKDKIKFAINVFRIFIAENTQPNEEGLRAVSDALAEFNGWEPELAYLGVYAGWLAIREAEKNLELGEVWKDIVASVIVGMQRGLGDLER